MTSTSKTNVLHLLAASSNPTALDAVQNLLKFGQKHVNEREAEGLTALHVAAAWDNLAMCQLLMFFGADPLQEDDNGRTPKDMAKGSVKKFFERLYGTESLDGGRNIRESFMRGLIRLFSCATPSNAIKKPSVRKRTRSWSPSYDGTKNFLSEEEKQLRWAFRKNQPLLFGRKSKKTGIKQLPLSPIVGKSQQGKPITATVNGYLSSARPHDRVTLPVPESDDNATFTTAREHISSSDSELAYRHSSGGCASDVLSREIASLEIAPVPRWPKDWMTEESTSDESKSSSLKIPTKILKTVRQMSDEELKQELTRRGEYIGPLIESTRAAYQLKLARLIANMGTPNITQLKYSWALEQWMAGRTFPEGPKLDELIIRSFVGISREHWREGNRPTSFCYILIDPSLIAHPSGCTMRQFVDSIFYIGKGKRSRPLQHLVDAVRAKDFGDSVLLKSKKLQKIVNLWATGHGVVSLHVFQNTVPVEAFTREAAMIDAIGIENLTNVKRGDYYGAAKNWPAKEKAIYGSYLLSEALAIFHVEGCREIYENDVQGK